MGVEPENIERSLRGRRTLPRPGEEVHEAAGGGAPRKRSSPDAGTPVEAGEERQGPGGQLYTKEEERRFQARGGRHNAASEGDRI